jgi:hypothetical protein
VPAGIRASWCQRQGPLPSRDQLQLQLLLLLIHEQHLLPMCSAENMRPRLLAVVAQPGNRGRQGLLAVWLLLLLLEPPQLQPLVWLQVQLRRAARACNATLQQLLLVRLPQLGSPLLPLLLAGCLAWLSSRWLGAGQHLQQQQQLPHRVLATAQGSAQALQQGLLLSGQHALQLLAAVSQYNITRTGTSSHCSSSSHLAMAEQGAEAGETACCLHRGQLL